MSNNTDPSARDTIPGFELPPDHELDAAMREKLAIEHAEHDLAMLRHTWAQRTGGRILALFLGGATALALMCSSPSAIADEPPKVKRPAMCLKGEVLSRNDMVVFVCLDGKKPRIFTRFIQVDFLDADGNPATYTLGWNAPLTKSKKGGYSSVPKPVAKRETERM